MSKNGTIEQVIKSWYRGWTDEALTTPNGSLYHNNGVLYSYGDHFPLALCIGDKVLINGDRYSNSTAKHQSYTIRMVSEWERVEIPFSALAGALGKFKFGNYGLDMQDLKTNLRVIAQEGDTWIKTGRFNKDGEEIEQHILGACIFRYGYNEDARYFFSGIDETGIGKSRYFLTELVAPVESVAEGLESMKPQEVKEAEQEGNDVLRQGEWFFVGLNDFNNKMTEEFVKSGCDEVAKDYRLVRSEGDTGHHIASLGFNRDGMQFVKGVVKHEEKDHKVCKLYSDVKDKRWYVAYHNVQVKSYNAVGNVD